VRPVPGKGLGLVATRNINQGEVILSEDPLLFINNDDNEILKSLNSQFENLSAENKKKVICLCDPDPEGEEDQKIRRIFTVNRIQANHANGSALYPTIPRINHSCSPSVVWSWKNGNTRRKEVRALHSIKEGEELCSNYIDDVETNYNTKDARQACLAKWNFVCSCPVCSLPEDKLRENDAVRR